jgi:hypothetical protein
MPFPQLGEVQSQDPEQEAVGPAMMIGSMEWEEAL